MTEQERKEEQDRARDNARFVEMMTVYARLSDWDRVRVNCQIVGVILRTPGSIRHDADIIWTLIRHGVFPFFAPYIPVVGLFLAAAVAWAWALTDWNEFIFVASLALGVAAFIKAAPLVLPSDSDEVE